MASAATILPLAERESGVRSSVMDETAFREFYAETGRRLRGYLLRCLGDAALADDLLQEAYLRFLRAAPDTEDGDHRRNYLFRIATNLVRDHFRKRRREYEMPSEMKGASGHHAAVEMRADVAQALEALAPRDRQMLWLAYVEGSSHQEIAAALGLKTASLKSMLFRARGRLAESLRVLGLQPERGGGS